MTSRRGSGAPLPAQLALLGLAVLGAVLGVVGALFVPLRVGGVPVPVSPLLALLGNAGLGVLAVRAHPSRFAALAPAAGWFVMAVLLSLPGPGGDVILPGSLMAFAFLLLGAVGSAVAVGVARVADARRSQGPPDHP